MRKIEKLVVVHGSTFDFNVVLVGTGKNRTIYFLDSEYYYDANGREQKLKVGVPAKFVEEYLIHMDMKSFKKIAKALL